jgi:hypothetical protein
MAQQTVTIGAALNPAQLTINENDTVVWINASAQVQTVTSQDGGATFTTGPIQVNSRSLPILFANASAGVGYTCTSGLNGTVIVRTSFENSVRPFFTAVDRNAMMDSEHTFGLITFDLWSAADCQAHWDAIHDAIANGSMPPAGDDSDGPWAQEKIDRFVAIFTAWKDGAFQP